MPSYGTPVNGPRIRELRLRGGDSVERLAIAARISPATLRMMEKNPEHKATRVVVRAIADALGVAEDELLADEPSEASA